MLIIVRHRLTRLNIDVLQANLKRLGNFVTRILKFYLNCPIFLLEMNPQCRREINKAFAVAKKKKEKKAKSRVFTQKLSP